MNDNTNDNTWQVVLADWRGNTYPSIAAAHRALPFGGSMTVTVARGNEVASQEQGYRDGGGSRPSAAVLFLRAKALAAQLNAAAEATR